MKPPLILAGYLIRSRSGGPRRFLDASEAEPDCDVLAQYVFATDEDLEDFYRRMPGIGRRAWEAARLLWRHRRELRQAERIYCLDHMSFNLLLLASRGGLFDTRGKIVRRFTFRDRAMRQLQPWLKKAPAFQVDLITNEQTERWASSVGNNHVGLLSWRIDTAWYQPKTPARAGPWFLPGNAYRDDSLVRPLLDAGHAVTRAGRSFALADRLRHCAGHPGFTLMMNASHADYLAALRRARAVVLPILTCDEPAGLTAAMEALACAVPLLANRSMGISELLKECEYPLPMLEDLQPETWTEACRRLDERLNDTTLRAALEHSRQLLIERRSIRPGNTDWLDLFNLRPAAVPAVYDRR